MRSDTANFTFTGNNQAMVDWTHTESGYAATCKDPRGQAADRSVHERVHVHHHNVRCG